jgi:hypothetical protein
VALKPTNNYTSLAKTDLEKTATQPAAAPAETMEIGQTVAPTQTAPMAPTSTATAGMTQRRGADQFAKNNVPIDADGDIKLGDPKVYDSVGEAGSGFVNLSHMLGLNRGSGSQSAKTFAKGIQGAGVEASAGITRAEDEFTKQSKAGMGWTGGEAFDPASGQAATDKINEARNAAYTGPASMGEMSGYADLSKKVSGAQEAAKNSQTGYGMAAEVNKQTGLSPIQSAASAFYMGVNNPNVKRAGSAFTNLQSALDKANQRSMDSSKWAKGEAERYRANADPWQKEQDDFNATAAQTDYATKMRVNQEQDAANTAARDQVINDNHDRPRAPGDPLAVEESYRNIKMGVPAELAYAGVNYEDWVAMGKPSYEKWKKDHPEAVPLGEEKK